MDKSSLGSFVLLLVFIGLLLKLNDLYDDNKRLTNPKEIYVDLMRKHHLKWICLVEVGVALGLTHF